LFKLMAAANRRVEAVNPMLHAAIRGLGVVLCSQRPLSWSGAEVAATRPAVGEGDMAIDETTSPQRLIEAELAAVNCALAISEANKRILSARQARQPRLSGAARAAARR
jgi:hypothetical protein